MDREIKKVALLGANGNMGYGSGALFTRSDCEVTFLARSAEKAQAGLDSAKKQVRSVSVGSKASVGSYDDNLEQACKDADIIFEAVAENMAIKNEMFDKVDKYRRPDSIVATVSSGLDISKLAENRSDSFKKHFLGLHYFNPPNVIVGTEIIPGEHTDPGIVDFLIDWCTKSQNRVMVKTANTPGFAGNRIGFKVLNEAAQLAEEYGSVYIDYLVGRYTGRAMPPLATIDLVGFDVHKAIVDNVVENVPEGADEAIETYKLPAYMQKLIDQGILGMKTRGGFFKRVDRVPHYLDFATGEYKESSSIKLPKLDFMEKMKTMHRIGRYEQAMKTFASAEGDEAKLAQKVIAGYISYSFHRAGEITETITGIDMIMGTGFNWAPPSVLVDLIGVKETVQMMDKCEIPVPASLKEADPKQKFFNEQNVNLGKFFVAK
ncbi:MAG: 3-hydroxyacyl-CoA dehydrogenase family protein [SAR324 cluster bacterium]|nr:3-hydroxyacyl-CoA dehydrogenase family protein [SAR324 cluster bacterium]